MNSFIIALESDKVIDDTLDLYINFFKKNKKN